jgi:hypothetical protein
MPVNRRCSGGGAMAGVGWSSAGDCSGPLLSTRGPLKEAGERGEGNEGSHGARGLLGGGARWRRGVVSAGVRRNGGPGREARARGAEKQEGRAAKLTEVSRGGEKAKNGVATKTGGDFDGELGEKGVPGGVSRVRGIDELGWVLHNREKRLGRRERRRRA